MGNIHGLKKYLVVQCPYCGMWQVTSAKILNCKYCRRTRKIKQERVFGLAVKCLYNTDNASEAARVAAEANGKKAETKRK